MQQRRARLRWYVDPSEAVGRVFIGESATEVLGVTVLSRTTRLDGERGDADAIEPGSKLVGDELRAVVAADVLRPAGLVRTAAASRESIGETGCSRHMIPLESPHDPARAICDDA